MIAFTIHLPSNKCQYVYDFRHLFAGSLTSTGGAMKILLIRHIQLPIGQLGVLQDRHIPLHRIRIVSCRSD